MSIEASTRVLHSRAETVTAADLAAVAELSGEQSSAAFGIAFVLALRALIDSGILPDKAIMLGHRVTWLEPPSAGAFMTEISIPVADVPRSRYQRVVIGYSTSSVDNERLVLEQEQEVLWPITI